MAVRIVLPWKGGRCVACQRAIRHSECPLRPLRDRAADYVPDTHLAAFFNGEPPPTSSALNGAAAYGTSPAPDIGLQSPGGGGDELAMAPVQPPPAAGFFRKGLRRV